MEGVVQGEPVPTCVPNVDADHQRTLAPLLADALKLTVPVPHLALPVKFVIVGRVFTVTVP